MAVIRQAKKRGVDVTCETAPHYLILDDSALEEEGRFKMNPPLRSRADREALLEMGVKACFGTGSPVGACVEKVYELVGQRPS